MFSEYAGGVFRGAPGKTDQCGEAFGQMRRLVHLHTGLLQPVGRVSQRQVAGRFPENGEEIHNGAPELEPIVYRTGQVVEQVFSMGKGFVVQPG